MIFLSCIFFMDSDWEKSEFCDKWKAPLPELNIYIQIFLQMLLPKHNLSVDRLTWPSDSKVYFLGVFIFHLSKRNLMIEYHFLIYFLEGHFIYWPSCQNFSFGGQTIKSIINLLNWLNFLKEFWLLWQTSILLFKTKYVVTTMFEQ